MAAGLCRRSERGGKRVLHQYQTGHDHWRCAEGLLRGPHRYQSAQVLPSHEFDGSGHRRTVLHRSRHSVGLHHRSRQAGNFRAGPPGQGQHAAQADSSRRSRHLPISAPRRFSPAPMSCSLPAAAVSRTCRTVTRTTSSCCNGSPRWSFSSPAPTSPTCCWCAA